MKHWLSLGEEERVWKVNQRSESRKAVVLYSKAGSHKQASRQARKLEAWKLGSFKLLQ